MTLTQQQLFEGIDVLPLDLKTKMIDKLLSSITPGNQTIDTLWVEEARRRKREIERGDVALVNGEDVFRNIVGRFDR